MTARRAGPSPGPTSGGRVRVVEVSNSPDIWGAEVAVMELAAPLAARGIELVLASPPGGELAARWAGLGLPHVPLALDRRRGLRGTDGQARATPGQLVRELGASVRAVRAMAAVGRGGDVMTSTSLWTHLDCALAGRLARRPVVLDLHDIVRPGLGRTMLTAAARTASASVAVSGAVADCVGPSGRRDLRVMAPAVDLARFSPGPADPAVRRLLTTSPEDPLIGIVGRVDPEKGVDLVIRATAALGAGDRPAHLAVVGAPGLDAGSYLAEVQAEAARRLGARARFVGRVDDVPAVLRALDVLVNASVAEPFGLGVLEAQAAGVPVVATLSGGVSDFLTDGDNALLVPPGDEEALAGALARVLDPRSTLGAALARRGRRKAEIDHGLESFADRLTVLYRGLARGEPAWAAPGSGAPGDGP